MDDIRTLWELGFGNRLIAKQTGIPRGTVCYYLRKLASGAKAFNPETRGFRAFSPDTVSQVVELRKQGISNREIGIQTGMTESSAYQILWRLGWRAYMAPVQARARPLVTPELIAQVLELRAQDCGRKVIAGRLGMNEATVKNVLYRAGFKWQGCARKEPRSPQVRKDVSYLELDPGMAWCLGLIFGDGYLSRNRNQVSLTSGDKDVVEKFADLHGTPKVLERGNAWVTTWTSARLYRELQTYDLCPYNSKILQFPRLDARLMPHFVRGLIDSDGSFCRAGRDRLSHLLRFEYACICGPFMHDFREVLVGQAGLDPERNVRGRYQTDTHNKVWKLKYSHTAAVRVGHWVYTDSAPEIRCNRKYAIWNLAKDHVLFARNSDRIQLPAHRKRQYGEAEAIPKA